MYFTGTVFKVHIGEMFVIQDFRKIRMQPFTDVDSSDKTKLILIFVTCMGVKLGLSHTEGRT
jgi:hypothetical protein